MKGTTLNVCAVFVLFLRNNYGADSVRLKEEFTWTRISYDIPSIHALSENSLQNPSLNDNLLQNEDETYIYENSIPMGANRWQDKLFITVPRQHIGVPSTLHYIHINSPNKHNVPLIPYPDVKTNAISTQNEEERIVSVYRVAIDQCDRLWMVDTGIVQYPDNNTRIGSQKIVIIDLNTDKIVKTYKFKASDLACNTILALLTVDVSSKNCDDAYAYIPDYAGYGLIVYSLKEDDSWRINHNYFHIDPLGGELHIGGLHFQWDDGLFSGVLADTQADGYKTYIFHVMAGSRLYGVSTKILQNKELATRTYHGKDFFVIGDRGNGSQTSATDLHKSSAVLFLALINQNGVGCWNTKKPFEMGNFAIIQKDDNTMIYPADLKIYQDDMIVLTNRMPNFLYSKLNYDDINFRVFIGNVYEAVNGTVCQE